MGRKQDSAAVGAIGILAAGVLLVIGAAATLVALFAPAIGK